jgi:hypothetical protein
MKISVDQIIANQIELCYFVCHQTGETISCDMFIATILMDKNILQIS